jgi:hypothetical protein
MQYKFKNNILKNHVVCPWLSKEQRETEGDSFAEGIAGSITERPVRIDRHCRSTICALPSSSCPSTVTNLQLLQSESL